MLRVDVDFMDKHHCERRLYWAFWRYVQRRQLEFPNLLAREARREARQEARRERARQRALDEIQRVEVAPVRFLPWP